MACEKSADASLAPPRHAWQQMSAAQTLVFPCAHYILNSRPRAYALHCLLTQAVRSLMACEKQMSAAQTLVFPCAHYILNSRPPRIRAPLPANAGGSFVNGL